MKQPTAQDILNDIEFEIAQGMLSKESFGPALEAVRQFQNRLRTQTFGGKENRSIKMNDPYREIISRQFQSIDMLLAVLQEMALRIQALQTALENLGRMPAGAPAPEAQAVEASTIEQPNISSKPDAAAFSTEAALFSADEVLKAMRPETITIPLQTRVIRWPVIGGLLTRLRIFYQRPAMHYTALLSERQAPVNRTFGDRILHLEALLQEQQQQIQALKAKAELSHDDQGENHNTVP